MYTKSFRKLKKKNKNTGLTFFVFLLIFIVSIAFSNIINKGLIKRQTTLDTQIIKQCFKNSKEIHSPESLILCDLMIRQLGKPYEYGSDGPKSFDCSGLVEYLFSKIGVKLPRVVSDQSKIGIQIDKSSLEFGDLVFFSGDDHSLTHIGIYLANGYFLHAPKTGDVIKVSNLGNGYYSRIYKMSVRVLV